EDTRRTGRPLRCELQGARPGRPRRARRRPSVRAGLTVRPASLLVLAAAMLAGCGSSSGHRRTVVTATGHIGPLRVDESDRGNVISFAGKPDSERHGRYDDYPPFDALGYGCRGKFATDPAGLPRCRTVFYLD